jgi:EmrB/QacA subfamily drug resistance transporter
MPEQLLTPEKAGIRPARRHESAARPDRSGIALAVILSSQLMVILDETIVNVALSHIRSGLHFSTTGLSWVVNAYILTFGGLLLLGGRAGDILGRRRIFIAGVLLFTLASLLGGMATSAGWLVATRAMQGAGAALAAPSALGLITTNFPEGPERTRALSLFASVSAAGASIGLIAGGMLTSWVSWRWVFFVNVPLGIAIALLASRFIQESERHPGRFDLGGALTSTLGVASLVYGFIRAAAEGWGDGLAQTAFAGAAILLGLFFAIELRAAQPILPLRLFADRNRAGGYLNNLLLPASLFSMFFLLSQFVQVVLGFSPVQSGFAFLPFTLSILLSSHAVTRLLPRFGSKPIMVTGAALIAIAMLWLTQLSEGSRYAGDVLGPLLLIGFGGGLSFTPLSLAVLSGVKPEETGAASGLLQTMQQVGGSVGIAILVARFGSVSRDAADGANPHAVMAGAIGSAFVIGSLIAVLALLIAIFVITASPLSPDTCASRPLPNIVERVGDGQLEGAGCGAVA